MSHLPVIVSFGGINAAGRSSNHHGYRRMVIDALPKNRAAETWRALSALMASSLPDSKDEAANREYMRLHTLIRRIEESHFMSDSVPGHFPVHLAEGSPLPFLEAGSSTWAADSIPGCKIDRSNRGKAHLRVDNPQSLQLFASGTYHSKVSSAGQLPSGFNPGALYPSRHHPRGLEMAVYAASDVLDFLGIHWSEICSRISPDAISVYAGSAMSQLDELGYGGMLQARWRGTRPSTRNCPFGFAEMPADFINAYVLGNFGTSGAMSGACASFLYNLRLAVHDIQSGRARVALVGASEAPVTPEIIHGYAVMGALTDDENLRTLDGLAEDQEPDYRRACRPFAENRGFTLAESAQFLLLMDDALAIELGACIHGAVADVYINADGHKKSISSPGLGNYLSCCRALSCARSILGDTAIRERSFVLAHGTGTPQNRKTESSVLDYAAQQFGIADWPVAAIKCFVGHSIGAAAGDQIMAALGVWADGILPGIVTMKDPAQDVSRRHLRLSAEHTQLGAQNMDCALVNAKGFGGNNASAMLLAPHVVQAMMEKKHGGKVFKNWRNRQEQVHQKIAAAEEAACQGKFKSRYICEEDQVLGEEDLHLHGTDLQIGEGMPGISLDMKNPYPDMC